MGDGKERIIQADLLREVAKQWVLKNEMIRIRNTIKGYPIFLWICVIIDGLVKNQAANL